MKSTIISTCVFAFLSSTASAGPLPLATADIPGPNVVSIDKSENLHENLKVEPHNEVVARSKNNAISKIQKRGAALIVIGIAGTSFLIGLTKIACEIGVETVKNLGDWTEVREEFTKATVVKMWDENKDYNKYPAVACYNKGYSLQYPNRIDGKVSAKLELGQLNTDYDCMFIEAPNQFYTHGDGGYINLAYRYNSNRCSYDSKTGDLTCH
ncbi:hypothetical protein BKA66DRAFT_569269 [Pyrenochaeta sp. MPI-SDFR-AT-0127]|nr:hypothetical protein BKA66DRAFT_569269 [Pyrenochaeta sp. MPI-SDFR-AT-0127]